MYIIFICLKDVFGKNLPIYTFYNICEQDHSLTLGDVVNYIRATEFALVRLKTLPLCNRLIKETHAVLLESARGLEKNPGEFRYSQNW